MPQGIDVVMKTSRGLTTSQNHYQSKNKEALKAFATSLGDEKSKDRITPIAMPNESGKGWEYLPTTLAAERINMPEMAMS